MFMQITNFLYQFSLFSSIDEHIFPPNILLCYNVCEVWRAMIPQNYGMYIRFASAANRLVDDKKINSQSAESYAANILLGILNAVFKFEIKSVVLLDCRFITMIFLCLVQA